jgi:hypothetical protein
VASANQAGGCNFNESGTAAQEWTLYRQMPAWRAFVAVLKKVAAPGKSGLECAAYADGINYTEVEQIDSHARGTTSLRQGRDELRVKLRGKSATGRAYCGRGRLPKTIPWGKAIGP